jgi:hypothetical protein
MEANDYMKELRDVSLMVRGFILENPGLTRSEIIMKLEGPRLAPVAIRRMIYNGMIIVRDDRYYALGNSIMAKARRHRQKQRENCIRSLSVNTPMPNTDIQSQ